MSTGSGDFRSARQPGGGVPPAPRPERSTREMPIPQFSPEPLPRRRPAPTTIGVLLAVVLAAVALVLSLISLFTQPSSAPTPAANTSNPQAATDADKALCQAVAPLMKENDDRSNAFLATGEAGSPQRDAALTKFVTDTQDWARRTQQALDSHAAPPRFATRALQRYIDDMQLFVASVRPGAGTQYDEAAWTDSIVAYGGTLATCQRLGINW